MSNRSRVPTGFVKTVACTPPRNQRCKKKRGKMEGAFKIWKYIAPTHVENTVKMLLKIRREWSLATEIILFHRISRGWTCSTSWRIFTLFVHFRQYSFLFVIKIFDCFFSRIKFSWFLFTGRVYGFENPPWILTMRALHTSQFQASFHTIFKWYFQCVHEAYAKCKRKNVRFICEKKIIRLVSMWK